MILESISFHVTGSNILTCAYGTLRLFSELTTEAYLGLSNKDGIHNLELLNHK